MTAALRQKAKDLLKLAFDESTSESERGSALVQAGKLIVKHDLLTSPLDGILASDNESVQAVATIVDKLSDKGLVDSVKKVARGLRRRR